MTSRALRPRLRPLAQAVLLGVLCATPLFGAAPDPAATATELKSLRARIAQLQHSLDSAKDRKDRLAQQLRAVEREVGEASRRLRQLKQQLHDGKAQLQALLQARDRAAQRLAAQRDRLAREVRGAYAAGRQERVKLVLNQEDPGAVGRMLTYYQYFARARGEHIAAVDAQLQELARLELALGEEQARLAALRDEQAQKTTQLQHTQAKRSALLETLQRDIKAKGSELKRLARDEKRLQELVRSLQDLLADIPRAMGDNRPFLARKGSLGWPTHGRVLARYGTPRKLGDLKWKGVLIGAPEGTEVRNVSRGRVAFADWLRGFGLLIIVDHGDGYMSLYGHNQSLYKEAGEWVEADELIATVGASGGLADTGLYFELRHNGQPINPQRWCAGKVPASLRAQR